jgi:hypothetical protein
LPKVADKISNAEELDTSAATANSTEEKKIVRPDKIKPKKPFEKSLGKKTASKMRPRIFLTSRS